jgi:hypothetical protein
MDKDGLLINGYLELEPEGAAVIKRPGNLFLGNVCAGTGQGAASYGSRIIFIACDTLFVASHYIVMTATVSTSAP